VNLAGRTRLPAQPTLLIGRDAELEGACLRFMRPEVRLLTLLGPGGVGKTRLAAALAERLLAHFADGVVFVDLAAVRQTPHVIPAVAEALAVPETPKMRLADAVRDLLRDKQMLLVLDNFEHVVAAGIDVAVLLAGSRQVKFLVTSREPLRISWEHRFAVRPLAVPRAGEHPTTESLGRIASVALFVERAQAAQSDFCLTADNAPAVASICRHLDGLPLAIELAAGRMERLTPQGLLPLLKDRLELLTRGARDLPTRHQTMRAALAGSYDLLDADEQRLFRRLGVFVGGATLNAVEAVCDASGDVRLDVREGLDSLVSKNLVRQMETAEGEARFGMLETISEFALEQLAAAGETELANRRHALYFVSLAETASALSDRSVRFNRLEAEHDNLRAALQSAAKTDAKLFVRMAATLGEFWWARGHLSEAQRWLDLALATNTRLDPAHRADLLFWDARVAVRQVDVERASARYEECLALQRSVGDRAGAAVTLQSLATVAMSRRDPARAVEMLRESIAARRDLGITKDVPLALGSLGLAYRLGGDLERAAAACAEGVLAGREQGDTYGTAISLGISAVIETDRGGDLEQASAAVHESIRLFQQLADRWGLAHDVEIAARIASSRGQLARAARLFGAAEAIFESIGAEPVPPMAVGHDVHVRRARDGLSDELFMARWNEGRALLVEGGIELAVTDSDEPHNASVLDQPTANPACHDLTRRECEVAALVAQGKSNRHIAQALVISHETAAVHVKHILAKLGFTSRTQIAAWAAELGLLSDDARARKYPT
jgi:predicted ATPase/DNA-binding CsgD family transcriptional regulator